MVHLKSLQKKNILKVSSCLHDYRSYAYMSFAIIIPELIFIALINLSEYEEAFFGILFWCITFYM